MIVSFNKLPKGLIGPSGPYYLARAVAGKLEVAHWVMSMQNLPKFITRAEKSLKEPCSEVIFHSGLWTKTRNEIMKEQYDI